MEHTPKYYFRGDITIQSDLGFDETAAIVAATLQIPPFAIDTSGRWEDQEVWVSQALGFRFAFSQRPHEPENQYGLTVDLLADLYIYDGTEKEVDASAYLVALLSQDKRLKVSVWS